MLAFKSVFIFFVMFTVSVYMYAIIVRLLVNKSFSSRSDDELCRLTIDYHKLMVGSAPIENYSFAEDVKRVLKVLNEKNIQNYLMFDKSSAIMYIIFTLLILLINSFGKDEFFVVYVGVTMLTSIIMEIVSNKHQSIYSTNCLQLIQYVKDLYGEDVNDVFNDSTMVYQ